MTIANQQQDTSTSAILGADAELASWMQILMEHGKRLKADLLKISHHGSQYGSDEEMLAAIRPQYIDLFFVLYLLAKNIKPSFPLEKTYMDILKLARFR